MRRKRKDIDHEKKEYIATLRKLTKNFKQNYYNDQYCPGDIASITICDKGIYVEKYPDKPGQTRICELIPYPVLNALDKKKKKTDFSQIVEPPYKDFF